MSWFGGFFSGGESQTAARTNSRSWGYSTVGGGQIAGGQISGGTYAGREVQIAGGGGGGYGGGGFGGGVVPAGAVNAGWGGAYATGGGGGGGYGGGFPGSTGMNAGWGGAYATTTYVDVPELRTVDKFVEVPEVEIQEVMVSVPRREVQYVEKVVEVPEIHQIVEVPKIEYQEVIRTVPRREVQLVEKVVEVPQVEVQEVVRTVPKVEYQYVRGSDGYQYGSDGYQYGGQAVYGRNSSCCGCSLFCVFCFLLVALLAAIIPVAIYRFGGDTSFGGDNWFTVMMAAAACFVCLAACWWLFSQPSFQLQSIGSEVIIDRNRSCCGCSLFCVLCFLLVALLAAIIPVAIYRFGGDGWFSVTMEDAKSGTAVQFDCENGFWNWERGWSEAKKDVCCKIKDCGSTGSHVSHVFSAGGSTFSHVSHVFSASQCSYGFANCQTGWSEDKQHDCCAHHNKCCVLLN